MRTAIICISDPYLYRALQLKEYYESKEDEVIILTPDFSHRYKKKLKNPPESVVYLPHPAYKKNLSLQRLYGHYAFSKNAADYLESWRPDRIHAMVPANSIAYFMARYKKAHPKTLLYFDINDLWPESFPLSTAKKLPPFEYWKRMRNDNLAYADHVLAECGLFSDILHNQTGLFVDTAFWSRSEPALEACFQNEPDTLSLAYLGSINNILDIEAIANLCKQISKKRTLYFHLIGSGEKKEDLLAALSGYPIQVVDHHEVFDPQKKQEILNQCDFGINIMKEGIVAGLSMKSIDYLACSLPILNSMKGDIEQICKKHHAGIQIDPHHMEQSVQTLLGLSFEEKLQMRRNAKAVFERYFQKERLFKTLDQILEPDQNSKPVKNSNPDQNLKPDPVSKPNLVSKSDPVSNPDFDLLQSSQKEKLKTADRQRIKNSQKNKDKQKGT